VLKIILIKQYAVQQACDVIYYINLSDKRHAVTGMELHF